MRRQPSQWKLSVNEMRIGGRGSIAMIGKQIAAFPVASIFTAV
jgi:hypothetical protein